MGKCLSKDGEPIGVGPVAIVTGGSARLGLEITQALTSKGYRVVITTRKVEPTKIRTAASIGAELRQVDVSDPDASSELIDEIIRDLGRVDVLVNNASSYHTGPLTSMGIEALKESIEGCLYTSMFPTLAVLPHMIRRGTGRIVNIGIAGSERVREYRTIAAHASAKTALHVLTVSLARELEGTGVSISMVNPGTISFGGTGPRSQNEQLVTTHDVVERILRLLEIERPNGVVLEVG